MYDRGMPRPDLLVVTGDLTESGSLGQFGQATALPHRPAAAARSGAAPAGDRAGSARRHQGRGQRLLPHLRGRRRLPAAALLAEVAAFRGPVRRGVPGAGRPGVRRRPAVDAVRGARPEGGRRRAQLDDGHEPPRTRTAYPSSARRRPPGSPSGCAPIEESAWLRLGAIGHPPAVLRDAPDVRPGSSPPAAQPALPGRGRGR